MEVKIPEPVGKEVFFFDVTIKNKIFDKKELSDLFLEIDEKMEEGCEAFKTKEYAMVDYNFVCVSPSQDRFFGRCSQGGFLPVIEGELNESSPYRFKKNLREALLTAYVEYDGTPMNIYAHFVAWRDSIQHSIEAQNPY